MKYGWLAAVIGFSAVSFMGVRGAVAGDRFTADAYGLMESFKWEENHGDFVKENGSLYGAGGDLGFKIVGGLWLEGHGEFFGGNVDYDGHLQNLTTGELTPYSSKTEYVGGKLGGDVAYKFEWGIFSLKPFLGLGNQSWRRTLDKRSGSSYIGAAGYVEDWTTTYGVGGVAMEWALGQQLKLFVSGELHLPIANYEYADLSNVGGPSDVTLKPGTKAGGCGEVGITYRWLYLAAFCEVLNFSESDLDDSGQFLQPASKETVLGARAGFKF